MGGDDGGREGVEVDAGAEVTAGGGEDDDGGGGVLVERREGFGEFEEEVA